MLVNIFQAGVDGVIQRGKAELNDKTMVDALNPARTPTRTADTLRSSPIESRHTVCHSELFGFDLLCRIRKPITGRPVPPISIANLLTNLVLNKKKGFLSLKDD